MAADVTRNPSPPASLRAGLRLVLVGAWLAVFDGIADLLITVRLLTHTFDDAKFGEMWLLAGARAVVYVVAVVTVLTLRRRTLQRANLARNGLIALLCLFIVGGIANLTTTWIQLLGAAMGGDYARPLEPWVNYTALASMAVDVVLMLLSLTAAVLLVAGRRWTTPGPADGFPAGDR